MARYGYYELFCGGGMVRAGLDPALWRPLFANDIDPNKTRVYTDNWGAQGLTTGDIRALVPDDLPGRAHLAWASFPCQDLSLAGRGAGLAGDRSGLFWSFWALMRGLMAQGRPPQVIALENVVGALTSGGGQDFIAICAAFQEAGYDVGALVMDAVLFTPQSRPRLFIVGARRRPSLSHSLARPDPDPIWTPPSLLSAYARLPQEIRSGWRWWRLDPPTPRQISLSDVLEDAPPDVAWRSPAQTAQWLSMMSPINREKVRRAQTEGRLIVGTCYRRTRRDAQGQAVQRVEARFDGVAGCLRTPAGGSSRQSLLWIRGDDVRSRLLSSREAARLMGLADRYRLPARYNAAYHLLGDGVVVPVARHLAHGLLAPLLEALAGPTRVEAVA